MRTFSGPRSAASVRAHARFREQSAVADLAAARATLQRPRTSAISSAAALCRSPWRRRSASARGRCRRWGISTAARERFTCQQSVGQIIDRARRSRLCQASKRLPKQVGYWARARGAGGMGRLGGLRTCTLLKSSGFASTQSGGDWLSRHRCHALLLLPAAAAGCRPNWATAVCSRGCVSCCGLARLIRASAPLRILAEPACCLATGPVLLLEGV